MAVTQTKFNEGMRRFQSSLDKILVQQNFLGLNNVPFKKNVSHISPENAKLREEFKKLKLWNNDMVSQLLDMQVRERRLNLIVHDVSAEKHNQLVTGRAVSSF